MISGNTTQYPDVPAAYGTGIVLDGAGSTGNLIVGNLIGTDPTGSRALGNGTGIVLSNASGNTIGDTFIAHRNEISGNDVFGIWMRLNSSNNLISANYFDLDSTGTVHIFGGGQPAGSPVTPASINLEDGSSKNQISTNVIAPKTVGISLVGAGVTGNVVFGNLIGIDATGKKAITGANFATGVLLGSPGNTIGAMVSPSSGGPGPIQPFFITGFLGNVLSGLGVAIMAAPSFNPGQGTNTDLRGSLVAGNDFGTDTSGSIAIPNYSAVDLRGGVTGLQIGGSISLTNVMANSNFGVELEDASKITIRANSIYDNSVGGITLTDRPTSNDNVPIPTLDPVVSIGIETGDRFITGTVSGKAGAVYTIDFYASPPSTLSPAIQGKTYLGSGTYTADANGIVTFTKSFQVPVDQPFVTATTTDAAGNTSDFSNANPQPIGQADLAFLPGNVSTGEVGRALSYTFSIVNNGPNAATGVTITQVIPAGFDFRTVMTGEGSATFANGLVTANIGTLLPGATTYLNIIGYPTNAGTLAATANVSADQLDPTVADNTQTLLIPISPSTVPVDLLGVSQTASPDPVTLGGTVTYSINVRNVSAGTAYGVQFNDVLPANVTLVSVLTTQGQVSRIVPGSIDINLGLLPANSLATVTILVRPLTTGAITNLAQVLAAEADPVPSNNSSVLTTQVIAAPSVAEGPRIIGLQRLGYHNLPTTLVLTFNTPLDPARAQDVRNYVLSATTEDARLTYRPTHRIATLSAVYDPVLNTVTLRPASRLDLHRAYHLTVVGTSATGVASTSGNLLDGAGTGAAGSNYAATFLGFNVIEIGDPPAKPKAAPRHLAAKRAEPMPAGATLFGHPNVLVTRRNRR